jgi:uncharacterized protein (DUF302 family)
MEAVEATIEEPIDEAESHIRPVLVAEGFGVLTEIDVAATLAAKLGVRRPPLKILAGCNPSLAHRALNIDPCLALLLPCNVVLEDVREGPTRVSSADPRAMLALGDPAEATRSEAHELGGETAEALRRALDRLGR